MPLKRNPPISVASQRRMVDGAIVRRLQAGGYDNLPLRTRAEAPR